MMLPLHRGGRVVIPPPTKSSRRPLSLPGEGRDPRVIPAKAGIHFPPDLTSMTTFSEI